MTLHEIRTMKRKQFVETYSKYFLATGTAWNARQSKAIIKKYFS